MDYFAVHLVELEQRDVVGGVVELHDELPAGARPRLVGLPHIGVGVRGRVVTQVAATHPPTDLTATVSRWFGNEPYGPSCL
jgi:hypothetical protein